MLVLALVAALGVASGAHAFSAKPALRTFSDSAREASGDLARNAAECVGKIGISVRRAHRSIPFNRFRYFDPEAGQYVAQDPIGLAGGAALYGYVHDPLSWVDPLGLSAWELDPTKDLDWSNSDKSFHDAVGEAFERTGVPREQFEVTQWGKTQHGKTVPVEWTAPGGAIVNVDDPTLVPTAEGPQKPHVGYQSPGKRGRGGRRRGHILLASVPATRGSLEDKKLKPGGTCG